MNAGITIVNIDNTEHYRWGDACDGWHLLKRDDMSVIQERMPAGTSEKMHYHKLSRQFFFVLEGTATMDVNGDRVVLEKNHGVEISPGVLHQLRNESNEELSFLVFSVPKSHGDRYER
jgi:mannose-6-phosphate isomerase-like protein (cupin superfamily)